MLEYPLQVCTRLYKVEVYSWVFYMSLVLDFYKINFDKQILSVVSKDFFHSLVVDNDLNDIKI